MKFLVGIENKKVKPRAAASIHTTMISYERNFRAIASCDAEGFPELLLRRYDEDEVSLIASVFSSPAPNLICPLGQLI